MPPGLVKSETVDRVDRIEAEQRLHGGGVLTIAGNAAASSCLFLFFTRHLLICRTSSSSLSIQAVATLRRNSYCVIRSFAGMPASSITRQYVLWVRACWRAGPTVCVVAFVKRIFQVHWIVSSVCWRVHSRIRRSLVIFTYGFGQPW